MVRCGSRGARRAACRATLWLPAPLSGAV